LRESTYLAGLFCLTGGDERETAAGSAGTRARVRRNGRRADRGAAGRNGRATGAERAKTGGEPGDRGAAGGNGRATSAERSETGGGQVSRGAAEEIVRTQAADAGMKGVMVNMGSGRG